MGVASPVYQSISGRRYYGSQDTFKLASAVLGHLADVFIET